MARGRLPMSKVKKVLEYHFDAGRSHRDIAMHCGVARRTVALLVERFESSGLGWPEAGAPASQVPQEPNEGQPGSDRTGIINAPTGDFLSPELDRGDRISWRPPPV